MENNSSGKPLRTTLVNNTTADPWMLELVSKAALSGAAIPEELSDLLSARTIEISDESGTYIRVIVEWA